MKVRELYQLLSEYNPDATVFCPGYAINGILPTTVEGVAQVDSVTLTSEVLPHDFERPVIKDGTVVCPGCGAEDEIAFSLDKTHYHHVELDDEGELTVELCRDYDEDEGFNPRMWCRECLVTFSAAIELAEDV